MNPQNQKILIDGIDPYFEESILTADKTRLERVLVNSGVKFICDFKHKYMTLKETGKAFEMTGYELGHLKELIRLADSPEALDRATQREVDRAAVKKERRKKTVQE